MFDQLSGAIIAIREKSITLLTGGVGYAVFTARPREFSLQSSVTLFTYYHWNQDTGPSLYGFQSELDRKIFLMIIDCPKIGPGIALNILSQLSAGQFVEVVTTGNISGLSAVNGIGAKKAEQIIVELKAKIQKLLTSGELKIEQQQGFVVWQQLSEVLVSLNYSKQEVGAVTQHLAEKYTDQNYGLDQLIRAALAYLSQKQA